MNSRSLPLRYFFLLLNQKYKTLDLSVPWISWYIIAKVEKTLIPTERAQTYHTLTYGR